MNFTIHARTWLPAVALFLGAALGGTASANAQAVASKPEADQAGFPTGEQALLAKFPGLTIQADAVTGPLTVGGPEALLHGSASGPLALGGSRDTGITGDVCGEMALLHRHSGTSP